MITNAISSNVPSRKSGVDSSTSVITDRPWSSGPSRRMAWSRRDERQRQIEDERGGREDERVEDPGRQDLGHRASWSAPCRSRRAACRRASRDSAAARAGRGAVAPAAPRGSGVASRPRIRDATSPGNTSSIAKMMIETSSNVSRDSSTLLTTRRRTNIPRSARTGPHAPKELSLTFQRLEVQVEVLRARLVAGAALAHRQHLVDEHRDDHAALLGEHAPDSGTACSAPPDRRWCWP